MSARVVRFLILMIVGTLFLQGGAVCQAQQTEARRKLFEETKAKATKGDSIAQFNLGVLYENGEGVETNYAQAVYWYSRAGEQGFTRAQFNLGGMYADGEGIKKDFAEALKWYRKAAEQGDANAQFNLGVLYRDSQVVKADYAEALKWFRKAAEQGHASAQFNLGLMYHCNEGVKDDYFEAVKWYRMAAEQGSVNAQNNLAVMYNSGQGVEKDYIEAYAWYNLAARVEKMSAQGRDATEKKMTPQQIADAQQRTKELKALIDAKLKAKEGSGELNVPYKWNWDFNRRRNYKSLNPKASNPAPGLLGLN